MSQEIFVSDDGKIKLLNGREEGMRLVNSQTRQIVTQ